MNLSTSDIVAWAAAFIALCSLFATIWQGCISHSHNRKSVRPILNWMRSRTLEDKKITLRFSIKNDGFGPAIVKDYFFTLNGNVVPRLPNRDYVRDVVEQTLGRRYDYVLRRHGLPGVGSAIASDGECIVADLEFANMTGDLLDAVLKSINIEFNLSYDSIYGERKTLTA